MYIYVSLKLYMFSFLSLSIDTVPMTPILNDGLCKLRKFYKLHLNLMRQLQSYMKSLCSNLAPTDFQKK